MKAHIYDEIETLVDVRSEFRDRIIARGARGTVVERYMQPDEGYAVDLAIRDDTLVGGLDYENVILFPDQFIVVNSAQPREDTDVDAIEMTSPS